MSLSVTAATSCSAVGANGHSRRLPNARVTCCTTRNRKHDNYEVDEDDEDDEDVNEQTTNKARYLKADGHQCCFDVATAVNGAE